MARYENILETIGRMPLVRLRKITRDVTSTVYVKAEAHLVLLSGETGIIVTRNRVPFSVIHEQI